jgi:hypothetical protein
MTLSTARARWHASCYGVERVPGGDAMKLPITGDGLSPDRAGTPARPVPRVKRSLATSLCPGASVSWAQARRAGGPYRYSEGCFCASPEQHGAQFQSEGALVLVLKGHC